MLPGIKGTSVTAIHCWELSDCRKRHTKIQLKRDYVCAKITSSRAKGEWRLSLRFPDNSDSHLPIRPLMRYGLAVLSVVISTIISILLRPQSFITPYLFHYPAILISAIYGGVWPGSLATLLSTLSVYYFQLPPHDQLAWDAGHVVRSIFFAASFGFICWLIDRHRKAIASQAGKDRIEAIVSSAMDAIISLDQDQRIVMFNPAAEALFGWDASHALGQRVDILIPERFREQHRQHVTRFSATGDTTRSMHSLIALMGLRSDETEFPFEATISQKAVAGEKLLTVILRDITQRKQSEEALIRSEKLASVGRLSASIAHEVNNPLDAIGNLLYLAESEPTLSAHGRYYLKTAQAELARVIEICRRTLAFSKSSGTVSTFRPTVLTQSVLALLDHKITTKRINCETEFLTDAEVDGVETDIRQVLWNLLGNALDAVPLEGTIKVRISNGLAQVGGEGVRVTVADSGGGIQQKDIRHLFEPFFTTKDSGNGLGLWVVSEIVKKHGGRISVRSLSGAKENTGAVFSVFLPATIPHRDSTGGLGMRELPRKQM